MRKNTNNFFRITQNIYSHWAIVFLKLPNLTVTRAITHSIVSIRVKFEAEELTYA